MKEKCPHCGQWSSEIDVDPQAARRARLLQTFTAGKWFRAHKMKTIGEPFEDFMMVLELEKEGLVERQTLSEEWKDTLTFKWIGPK